MEKIQNVENISNRLAENLAEGFSDDTIPFKIRKTELFKSLDLPVPFSYPRHLSIKDSKEFATLRVSIKQFSTPEDSCG